MSESVWTCSRCGRTFSARRPGSSAGQHGPLHGSCMAAILVESERRNEKLEAALRQIAGASWQPGVRMDEPSPTIRFTSGVEAAKEMKKLALAALGDSDA